MSGASSSPVYQSIQLSLNQVDVEIASLRRQIAAAWVQRGQNAQPSGSARGSGGAPRPPSPAMPSFASGALAGGEVDEVVLDLEGDAHLLAEETGLFDGLGIGAGGGEAGRQRARSLTDPEAQSRKLGEILSRLIAGDA